MSNATKKIYAQNRYLYTLTVLLFYVACLCMYNFYKSLSGFIANGFREPLVMVPIISACALPAFCFCVFFYDTYVKKMGRLGVAIYAGLAAAVAVWNCVGLGLNAQLYASNQALGGYDTMLKLAFGFPVDGWIFSIVLLLAQALNLVCVCKPKNKIAKWKESWNKQGACELGPIEYLLICVLAILVFVFVGAAICAIGAFENALYDGKFIFLWLWVLVLPLMNLLLLVFKPEKRVKSRGAKAAFLGAGIAVNILFGVLLWIFEAVFPDFIVHVGKPLFAIAFSVSLPIEMIGLLAIGGVCAIVLTIRLFLAIFKSEKGKE
jgi:hypothetical protein